MPLYEYKCLKCGKIFEKIQKMNSLEIQKCPNCEHISIRILNAPTFNFKGTGWYETDYKKGK
jgi:putative FmdB family regulatory protein